MPPVRNSPGRVIRQALQEASYALHPSRESEHGVYRKNWNDYKKFIDERRLAGELAYDANGPYLTRHNIDFFFTHFVMHRMVQPSSARRYVSSLQWYADTIEYAGQNTATKFVVESPSVLEALNNQKKNFSTRPAPVGAANLPDVDTGLSTNVLSHNDKIGTLKYILNHRPADWRECGISFTQGYTTFLRGASMRILKLSDLILNDTHAPTTGSRSDKMMLSIALRPAVNGAQTPHKDRHSHMRVVGALRHRNYLECPIGWLSFSFITRFFHRGHELQFGWPAGEPQMWNNCWRGCSVIEWDRLSKANDAFNSIFDALNLAPCKKTHFRTFGVDALRGQAEWRIATMTKHKTDKLSKSYMCELDPIILKICAGFEENEEYWISRSWLGEYDEFPLPYDLDYYISRLVPGYAHWCAQLDNPPAGYTPDDRPGVRKFLRLVRYFVLVAVQDGIYWIHEFPNHEVSNLLRTNIPNYENWAINARQSCTYMENMRQQDALGALADANTAAYTLIMNKFDEYRQVQDARHNTLLQEFRQTRAVVGQALFLFRGQQQAAQAAQVPMVAGEILPENQEEDPQDPIAPAIAPPENHQDGPVDDLENPPLNALDHLTRQPIVPDLPRRLEKSLREVLDHYLGHELYNFIEADKAGWSNKQRLAFFKRTFVYKFLCDNVGGTFRDAVSLENKADEFDLLRENQGESVAFFIETMRKYHGNYRPRVRHHY